MSQKNRDHMWSSFQEAFLEEKMGELVSGVLRGVHEGESSPVKKISRRTGIAPATIKKWYTGKKPPSIGHFLMLAQNYPEVLKAFLEASGHGYLTAYVRSIAGGNGEDRTAAADVVSDVPITESDVPINPPNERQHWFLILLRQANGGRAEDIAAEFGVSVKTARRDIRELKMAGKIRFVGARKTGSYEIIDKPVIKEGFL